MDIVISDISMPIMDGFELLENIRGEKILCHIQVIMLTVDSSMESKLKGLEYGADAYIEKPFSAEFLQATVYNLINSRRTMLKRYLAEPLNNDNEAIIVSSDQEWFRQLTDLIQQNLSEAEISIDYLAGQMNTSRSNLQRKVKGLTGLTPVLFIRNIRLKKAAELLSSGAYRINEVCYMVGFSKPSYFSNLFKKQFGVLPKDFIKTSKPFLNGQEE